MLQKFEIQGVGMTVDDSLKKYVTRKIGNLDKYLSKHDRESAHITVMLKEHSTKSDKHCVCEVVMHLPHQQIIIKESAMNMYAAVDIIEAKLKIQIKKYKDKHENGGGRRHVFARFRRRAAI